MTTKKKTPRGRGRPFKKGQSGNPGGRSPIIAEVRDLARKQTEESVNALISIRDNSKAPPAARVSAANSLLDRGWGKATQIIAGDEENPFKLTVEIIDPTRSE